MTGRASTRLTAETCFFRLARMGAKFIRRNGGSALAETALVCLVGASVDQDRFDFMSTKIAGAYVHLESDVALFACCCDRDRVPGTYPDADLERHIGEGQRKPAMRTSVAPRPATARGRWAK